MSNETLIGAAVQRYDAPSKVSGRSHYPADLVRPDMLQVKVIFAERPHARIVALDTATAQAHPGVVAVLTAADVPHNRYGLIYDDQPVLCGEVVRYVGDRVALVIADSSEAASTAAGLVHITYEDLPVVSDPYAALAPDAPLVHTDRDSNILYEVPIRKGDTAQALANADVVVEGTFQTTWQEHAFLQPEAGIAYIDDAGRVVVETAGQWLHEDRQQIASVLGLPEDQVVIKYVTIGGAFGGREDLSLQHLLALASWKTGQPTALVWTREESMLSHFKRHPMTAHCRWGATSTGKIVAVEAEVVADGGAYASTSREVVKVMALFASGCYHVPNIASRGRVVYTNNVPSGAFRGFGAPQIHFACELMIARLAEALGMDPVELRRRNIYREGDIEPTQHPLPPGVSALPVLERALAEVQARFGQEPPAAPHLKRGIGLASGIKNVGYSFGFPEQATAAVELYGGAAIERAVVRAGAADVGQGIQTTLRQIAAATLGIDLDQIEMICDDSSTTTNAGSASASRLTLMAGRAVHDAAIAAKQEWDNEERPATVTVQFRPPRTTALDAETTAGMPNYCYGYTTQAVEVEVNTLTGQVRVLKVISAHDVGKAINMQTVTGQIEGGVVQALGYALLENFQMHNGEVQTRHFSNYLLPTIYDAPDEIIPVVLELAEHLGPYGARGMAEMPCIPLAAAIAIAIHDATGIWLAQQPMTPERVLLALQTASQSVAPADSKVPPDASQPFT